MKNEPQKKASPRGLYRTMLFGASLALLLLVTSCSNLQPQGRRVQGSSPTPAPELTLPSPTKPTPLPAERVINILFTSNGDGDVDPCG